VIDQAELLKQTNELPTLPAATVRLATLINDPTAGAPEFVKVIKPDIALTANVLKLSNSAYFGLSREITSVRQAITLLGTKRIFELAASASFARVLPESIPGYEVEAAQFWKHCVAVAALSERFAYVLGLPTPDLTFTAGLLHDIGKLALGLFLKEHENEVMSRVRTGEVSLINVEKEVLGTDHAELGGAVSDHWQLPAAIRFAAVWHHQPNAAPPESDRVLIDLVHAADSLAHTLGLGADLGELHRRVDEGAIARLKVTQQSLEQVAAETFTEILDLCKLFEQTIA
jgi:putative nucleotidyltransferase with HDIG domain